MLPRDGSVSLIPLMAEAEADNWFKLLSNIIPWRHDEVIMFGKRIVTKRMMAWYGDAGKDYRYSGIKRQALPWSKELTELRGKVQEAAGRTFNSCLFNLYHDGTESMGWHRDNEPELDSECPIASLSLGAERKFKFRHRSTGERLDFLLGNGSLLVMHPPVQEYWDHQLPPMLKVIAPRINLTFRSIK